MKDKPDEYFLTGSEGKWSKKKGEGEVEKKRREVGLCAIPAQKVKEKGETCISEGMKRIDDLEICSHFLA